MEIDDERSTEMGINLPRKLPADSVGASNSRSAGMAWFFTILLQGKTSYICNLTAEIERVLSSRGFEIRQSFSFSAAESTSGP